MFISCEQIKTTLELNIQDSGNQWFELSDERYRLAVFGHLYCHSAQTLNLEQNARILFKQLCSSQDSMIVSKEIAGGLFSLFIFDKREQTLYIQGDRFGFKPLYYKKLHDRILFSDNAFHLSSSSRLSGICVDEFLSYGYLPYSGSLFEDIYSLKQGEMLKIRAGDHLTVTSHVKVFHCYQEPSQRVHAIDVAVDNLSHALDQFYSRFEPSRYCLGLSGGYDSRLIAASLTAFNPHLINFGNPQSLEVKIAGCIAHRLGLNLTSFAIPHDAVYRNVDQWRHLMHPYCDLSYAHVAILVSEIQKTQAQYYVDGFLGGAIIGSNYYYKLGKDPQTLLKNLLFLNPYCSEIKDLNTYCVVKALSATGKEVMMSKQRAHILLQKERCYTHEDMQESLLFTTRGRQLIASGPNAVSSQVVCLCPYIDGAVYDAAMAVSKELRAGNYLYNALWNRKFPEMSDIPKNDTGSSPNATPFGYRFKHARQAIKRRVGYPVLAMLTAGKCDYREEYSRIDDYLKDPSTEKMVKKELAGIAEEAASLLKISTSELLGQAEKSGELALRLLSLRNIF